MRSKRAQLDALDAKLRAAKGAEAPTRKFEDHHSQAHLAWRMVIELVTGIVIGFAIGYGLDSLFGTLPIFLVVFTLLGLRRASKRCCERREIQEQNGRTGRDEGCVRIEATMDG